MLNKGEAVKTVKTSFDIWKAGFCHKKSLLVPTLQKDWSKEGSASSRFNHSLHIAQPSLTQMIVLFKDTDLQ